VNARSREVRAKKKSPDAKKICGASPIA